MELLSMMQDAPPPLTLRYYQEEAGDAIANAFLSRRVGAPRSNRQLIVLPTGTGKTVLFASLPRHRRLQEWLEQFPKSHRMMLVIAHRNELIKQAFAKIRHANPNLKVQIEKADQKADMDCDIVVASIQTVGNRDAKRLRKFDLDRFRIVVIDETHHATASTYMNVLRALEFLPDDSFMAETYPGKNAAVELRSRWQQTRLSRWDNVAPMDRLFVGLTATSERGDKVGLSAVFQETVYSKTIRDMIQQGFLTPLRAFRVESKTSLDHIKTIAGDLDQGELARTVDTAERNMLAVKAWREHAPGRKTIAFCASVQHARDACETFNKEGIPSHYIHGAMPDEEREQILRDFADNKFLCLFNCNILTEGFDDPQVSCVLHLKPTKSQAAYIQMTGRGTRLWNETVHGFFPPVKTDCVVIDIVDLTRKHSLVTSPEMFGLPANFNGEGEDLEEVAQKFEKVKAENPHMDLSAVASLGEVKAKIEEVDLWGDVKNMQNNETLNKSADLLWVPQTDGAFELQYNKDQFCSEKLRIAQQPDGWHLYLNTSDGSVKQLTKSGLKSSDTALGAAENWLNRYYPKVAQSKRRDAPWLKGEATQAQIGYIMKLGGHVNIDPKTHKPVQPISMGDAYYMIERLKERAATKGQGRGQGRAA